MLDMKALAESTALIVREHVERATAPLLEKNAALEARLAALEQRPVDKGDPGDPGEPGAPGDPGQDGADGAGIADLVIDRDGALIASFTDGRMKSLGIVVGKDGEPGKDGTDGTDGLGPDDFSVRLLEDGRTVCMSLTKGEKVHAFEVSFPVVLDRGVYRADATYEKGDAVTWAGSLWIAQKETTAKPDGGEDWRLAVKRGRDGKDKA